MRRAMRLLDLRPNGSWVVGDSARNVLLPRDLGLRSALVHSGKPVDEQHRALTAARYRPDLECADLAAAADRIVSSAP